VALAEPGTIERPEVQALKHERGITVLTADTTDPKSLAIALDGVLDRFGAPNILVANAGADHVPAQGRGLDLTDLQVTDIERIVHTNVVGTILTISTFGGPMVEAGRGSIVLIGSQYAVVSPHPAMYDHLGDDGHAFVKNPAYGASKASIANLARYFAAHWGIHGVRVNVLSPGGIRSDQDPEFQRKFAAAVPYGRMIDRSELEGPLLFLASDASTGVTGTQILVDGGYSIW
jgi:NAD(P)-dependent dehydrogenase (short-subunit alcohol dehydrogenase family)